MNMEEAVIFMVILSLSSDLLNLFSVHFSIEHEN